MSSKTQITLDFNLAFECIPNVITSSKNHDKGIKSQIALIVAKTARDWAIFT